MDHTTISSKLGPYPYTLRQRTAAGCSRIRLRERQATEYIQGQGVKARRSIVSVITDGTTPTDRRHSSWLHTILPISVRYRIESFDISKYGRFDIYRKIERVLPSIPWPVRVLDAHDTERNIR